uniref:Uncharacterized protein n=1 Tax=Caldilinea aerophila TaxID=133453 RepID=A0A7C1FFS3_9CHLR
MRSYELRLRQIDGSSQVRPEAGPAMTASMGAASGDAGLESLHPEGCQKRPAKGRTQVARAR